jgi:hypothetical protein
MAPVVARMFERSMTSARPNSGEPKLVGERRLRHSSPRQNRDHFPRLSSANPAFSAVASLRLITFRGTSAVALCWVCSFFFLLS